MEDIRTLKSRRGGIKGQVTRTLTFLNSEIPPSAAEAAVRLNKLQDFWDKFDAIQIEIENRNIDNAALYEADQANGEAERTLFETLYYQAATKAQSLIDSANARIAREANQARLIPDARLAPPHEGNEARRARPKLPIIKLAEFKGDYTKWTFFKNSFEATIDGDEDLTPMQKLQYLIGVLQGEARQVIQGFAITDDNYPVAWQLLKDTYDNQMMIIETHLDEILKFPPITKENKADSIRQFIWHIQTHFKSLEALRQPVAQWETIIIHLAKKRLDFAEQRDWQNFTKDKTPDDMPRLDEFIKFLTERSHMLRALQQTREKPMLSKPVEKTQRKSDKKVSLNTTTISCRICSGDHPAYRCKELLERSISDRYKLIKEKQLCTNCLNTGHVEKNCKSSTCKRCSKRHNTVLHQDVETQSTDVVVHCSDNSSVEETGERARSDDEEPSLGIYYTQRPASQVILSTAQVYVHGLNGDRQKCRALLDPGSQSNIVTEKFAQKLKLPCRSENREICGVSRRKTTVRKVASIQLSSTHNDYTTMLECLVLPSITEDLPQKRIDTKGIIIPKDITLADPVFEEPGSIDILIGAALYWKIVVGTPRNRIDGQPALQNTQLGWILGGEITGTESQIYATCLTVSNDTLSEQVERFWKQETLPEEPHYTNEDIICEKNFQETVQRDESGRFIVCLPLRDDVKLGDSRITAYRRLKAQERRLAQNSELKTSYDEFMDDYIQQGHMSLVSNEERSNTEMYFLPHQAVIRPDSTTTKLRVVFDASTKTTLGTCLNDKLMAGPNLQRELINIILRFRTHAYVLTADVAAMFRQILVDEKDRTLQRILWRKNQNEPVQVYELNTVTYGTACAPFLAMRCLRQLAEENSNVLPKAARAVLEDCYMDDILTGTRDLTEAIELQKDLSQLLHLGQFHLRKWRSNDCRALQNLSEENKTDTMLIIDKEGALKTLGLLWNSKSDCLQYHIEVDSSQVITKRILLSKIAQVFDPLGLVTPLLITGKIIMQQLWLKDLEWDQAVPEDIQSSWETFYTSLPKLNDLQIPRNVTPSCVSEKFDVFGFGDASEKAFGACLYAVSVDAGGTVSSHLICSKSKVAPLKTISLPRLELEAALLLAKLYNAAKSAFGDHIRKASLWSDSTIVLGWIKLQPSRLKTFVANRISKIQNMTENVPWSHVPSEENPADFISRGITAEALANNSLWWHGPHWLTSGEKQPQSAKIPEDILPELKTITITMTISQPINDELTRFSSYAKLKRVIAYCKRFISNCKQNKKYGPLSIEELQQAETTIIRTIQRNAFCEEIRDLKEERRISRKSKLNGLDPFVDAEGLIRVGGRLRHASMAMESKHPMVLPAKNFITSLIIREEHIRLRHCPPEQLLSAVRYRFWPISGRREVKKIVKKCLSCFRFRPASYDDVKMGDLPKERVNAYSKPFTCTGIDYAGPLQIRDSKRRGRINVSKGYIAVFTCLSTKAVHLELVSDLTTEAFLAAFSRFTARRGMCSQVFSDNGTNFVGASRQLHDVYDFLAKQRQEIETHLVQQNIVWNFIPPRAPHFGGIWEAAVKITKRHLFTVTQGKLLTFEEYNTLLTNIEAILNSRPLTPLSEDPTDLTALTPSHFLIGDSLVQPVEHNYLETSDNRLSRWQYIQKLRQQFWSRWRKEYLQELQKRNKWATSGENIELNTLVLLKEDNVPPLQWLLGRVIALYPGQDGVVRVVCVKTKNGEYKRAVRKLCPIPMDSPSTDP